MFGFTNPFKSRSSSGGGRGSKGEPSSPGKSGKNRSSKGEMQQVQVTKPPPAAAGGAADEDVDIGLPPDMPKVVLEDFDLLKVCWRRAQAAQTPRCTACRAQRENMRMSACTHL